MQDFACPFDKTQLNCSSFNSTVKTAKASREIVKATTSCLFEYARKIWAIFSKKQHTAFLKSMFVQIKTALYKYSPDTQ